MPKHQTPPHVSNNVTQEYSLAIYNGIMQLKATSELSCDCRFKTALIRKSSVFVDEMASELIKLQSYDVNGEKQLW